MRDTTHPQTRLGTGYGAQTTAAEVLRGIDLSGRHAIVTGGYSGIGLETTRALAAAGATVSVPALRPEYAREQLAGLAGVKVAPLDLTDLDSVTAYAQEVVAAGRHVDMLIASAGIMVPPLTRVGPGWELQLAANHLGHFALVNQLWPALAGGARVVSVSSRGHFYSPMRWDDPFFEHTEYDRWAAYGQSKTANALFAVWLNRLGRDAGVRAFALHPGAIMTPLARHLSRDELLSMGAIDSNGQVNPNGKSPQQGAATQAWAATSAHLDGRGGLYLEDSDIAPSSAVQPYALDPAEAQRLWAWSSHLTGADAFA